MFGACTLLEAIKKTTAAEWQLCKSIHEFMPWGPEWEHTKELGSLIGTSGGITVQGRPLGHADIGPTPYDERIENMSREQQAATQRAFVAFAKRVSRMGGGREIVASSVEEATEIASGRKEAVDGDD